MFWHNFRGFHSLNSIIEKEGATLAEVLDDDTVIQELKGQNQKLLDL